MGAGKASLRRSIPIQLQLVGGLADPHRGDTPQGATPVQQYYHRKHRTTNQNHQPLNIPGGSFRIPPMALLMIWASYRQRKVNWLALRVWIALWEIRCWHEARTESDVTPRYSTSQIATAIRSPNMTEKRLRNTLSCLEQINLVTFTPTTIRIASSLDDLHDPELRQLAEEMIHNIGHGNVDRGLRIPRRMLVFLMASQRPRPVYAGVMFALLVRTMLTKRYDTYKGCCTASWIALVFGGDLSSIKTARAQLIADGWFARLETPQRVRQRHGEWVILVIEHPVENVNAIEPPAPPNPDVAEPPLQNQSLSNEIETNQSLHTGASQPSWSDIHPQDLRSAKRREQLYRSALNAKVITSCAADRHTFFAAIAHATRVATKNACGLLRRIIETPPYRRFITQSDEDRASAWLRPQPPEPPVSVLPAAEPTCDRQVVIHLRRTLRDAGMNSANPFALLLTTEVGKDSLEGWTKDRWDLASAAQDEADGAPVPFWLARSDWNLRAPRPLRHDGFNR